MIDDTDRTVEYDPYLFSDLTPDSTEMIYEAQECYVGNVTTAQNVRAVEYGSDWTEELSVDRTPKQNSVKRVAVEHYPDTTASHISTTEGKSPDSSVEQIPDSTDELITDTRLGHSNDWIAMPKFQFFMVLALAVVNTVVFMLAIGYLYMCFVYSI